MRKFTLTTLLCVYALISYAQQSNVNSANMKLVTELILISTMEIINLIFLDL